MAEPLGINRLWCIAVSAVIASFATDRDAHAQTAALPVPDAPAPDAPTGVGGSPDGSPNGKAAEVPAGDQATEAIRARESGDRCRRSRDCAAGGRCFTQGTVCVARSQKDCTASWACARLGRMCDFDAAEGKCTSSSGTDAKAIDEQLVFEGGAGMTAADDPDGVRFRGGISLEMGALLAPFIARRQEGVAAPLAGIDGRLGVQVTNLIGVYIQHQIAFASAYPCLGISGLVDFTVIDHIFFGAGAGGGFMSVGGLTAPFAGELHFRAGGYPGIGFGDDGIRRKGLLLGTDVRVHFPTPNLSRRAAVIVSPMLSFGYEAF